MLNFDKNGFLTKEQVKEQAPSVFSTTPSSEVSDKYTHIPTSTLIDDMEKLGWGVVDAKEVRARKLKTIGFQKHLLIFRNEDIVVEGADGDTVYPQILLTNSHDGKNSFEFTAGLFRLVCANGLVISTEEYGSVKMRHMGYTFEELQDQIKTMVEDLPLTVESMNKMKGKPLGEENALKFAKRALSTRFTEDQMKVFKFDLKELITPTRKEDEGNDVWSVYNIVQEKLIAGDFTYTTPNKTRKARQIKNFNQDLKVNQELFDMALELV